MSTMEVIDLASDGEEMGESDSAGGGHDHGLIPGTLWNSKSKKVKKNEQWSYKRQPTSQEHGRSGSADACSSGAASVLMEMRSLGTGKFSASAACSVPLCRQFWRARDYETQGSNGVKLSDQNGKNYLHVHPMFLHSNATSHKWVFGAIAELLDNAVDEVQNGATLVSIDRILNPRDGTPALLIQDNGGGMNPEAMRSCMSFGFSDKKMRNAIGQYGNGFKTSTIRLGADVIVFSRQMTTRRMLTQSVGLLSYTFLRKMGYERIVVPMVHYKFTSSTGTLSPVGVLEKSEEYFSSNLSTLLKWSPYTTEDEVLKQFDDIGQHGTKVIIYNLWLNDDGEMELDFNSDPEDILINGLQKPFQPDDIKKLEYDHHIAQRYHYSLRAYISILYRQLPQSFNIILRGCPVEHHNIADDLKFPEYILYKPQIGDMEVCVQLSVKLVDGNVL